MARGPPPLLFAAREPATEPFEATFLREEGGAEK
jgi:hypothetical protein